jgi:hypothetical protein
MVDSLSAGVIRRSMTSVGVAVGICEFGASSAISASCP